MIDSFITSCDCRVRVFKDIILLIYIQLSDSIEKKSSSCQVIAYPCQLAEVPLWVSALISGLGRLLLKVSCFVLVRH